MHRYYVLESQGIQEMFVTIPDDSKQKSYGKRQQVIYFMFAHLFISATEGHGSNSVPFYMYV